jgi:hypothetical protein
MKKKQKNIMYILLLILIIYIIYKYIYTYKEPFEDQLMDIQFKNENGKIVASASQVAPVVKPRTFPEFNIIYKNTPYKPTDTINILPGDNFTLSVASSDNYIIKSGSPDFNYIFLPSKPLSTSTGYNIGQVTKTKVGTIITYKCNISTTKDKVPLEKIGFRIKAGVFELNGKPTQMTESIYINICLKPDIEIKQGAAVINMSNNKYTLNNGNATLTLKIPTVHEKIYRFKPRQIKDYNDVSETNKTAITTAGPLEKDKTQTKVLTYTLKLLKTGTYTYKIKPTTLYVGSTIVTSSPIYDQEITLNIVQK